MNSEKSFALGEFGNIIRLGREKVPQMTRERFAELIEVPVRLIITLEHGNSDSDRRVFIRAVKALEFSSRQRRRIEELLQVIFPPPKRRKFKLHSSPSILVRRQTRHQGRGNWAR